MILSKDNIEFIKSNEGCPDSSFRDGLYHSYLDSGGEWTIYYGCCYDSDGCKVTKSTVWTEKEAEQNFIALFNHSVDKVNKLMKKSNVQLTQNQFGALVDFDYNTGALHTSTLWKKIVSGAPITEINKQFLRWVYDNGQVVKGLRNRRLKEIAYYGS